MQLNDKIRTERINVLCDLYSKEDLSKYLILNNNEEKLFQDLIEDKSIALVQSLFYSKCFRTKPLEEGTISLLSTYQDELNDTILITIGQNLPNFQEHYSKLSDIIENNINELNKSLDNHDYNALELVIGDLRSFSALLNAFTFNPQDSLTKYQFKHNFAKAIYGNSGHFPEEFSQEYTEDEKERIIQECLIDPHIGPIPELKDDKYYDQFMQTNSHAIQEKFKELKKSIPQENIRNIQRFEETTNFYERFLSKYNKTSDFIDDVLRIKNSSLQIFPDFK
jgi:hypothetical protein